MCAKQKRAKRKEENRKNTHNCDVIDSPAGRPESRQLLLSPIYSRLSSIARPSHECNQNTRIRVRAEQTQKATIFQLIDFSTTLGFAIQCWSGQTIFRRLFHLICIARSFFFLYSIMRRWRYFFCCFLFQNYWTGESVFVRLFQWFFGTGKTVPNIDGQIKGVLFYLRDMPSRTGRKRKIRSQRSLNKPNWVFICSLSSIGAVRWLSRLRFICLIVDSFFFCFANGKNAFDN